MGLGDQTDHLAGADQVDIQATATQVAIILDHDAEGPNKGSLNEDERTMLEKVNRLFCTHEKIDMTFRRVEMQNTKHIRYMVVVKFVDTMLPDIKIWSPNPFAALLLIMRRGKWPTSSS